MGKTAELKKLGNKVYALSVKIEESQKNGMTARIPGYVAKLNEVKVKINELINELNKEYDYESI